MRDTNFSGGLELLQRFAGRGLGKGCLRIGLKLSVNSFEFGECRFLCSRQSLELVGQCLEFAVDENCCAFGSMVASQREGNQVTETASFRRQRVL